MQSLLIWLSVFFTSPEYIRVSISEGTREEVPKEWTTIDSVKKAVIGTSYWAKVEINTTRNRDYVLQCGNWYMMNILFYDENMNLLKTGNELLIDGSGQKTFYLYYSFHDAKDTDSFTIILHRADDFQSLQSNKNIFQASFQSTLIFIFLISLFFAIRNRDQVYGNYSYYIGSILLFFSYQYGLLGNVFPIVRSIPPSWFWIISASITHSHVLFARSFLDLKTNDPFNYKILNVGQWFILLVVTTESTCLLFQYDVMHQLWYKVIVLVIELFLSMIFLYRVAKMRTPISNIYIIGALVLFIGSMTGQIASSFKIAYETNIILQISVFLDLFILTIGIAVRMGLIQKSRQETQIELINQLQRNEQLQQEYTTTLETKVRDRTMALDRRNSENETLLKEVHHRVKNNLQMITSLLSMQQRRLKEVAAKEALILTRNRVKSIGLMHEHLYKHDDFSKINLKKYTEDLISILAESMPGGAKRIKTEAEVSELIVDMETAMPIGLILNELITNSIKHAFGSHPNPELRVSIHADGSFLILNVIDNGKGLSDASDTSAGFGNTIIKTLLENQGGTIAYLKSVTGGLHVSVSFNFPS